MSRRWTIEELDRMGTIDFAIAVLGERKESLTNPYSPLSEKIEKTQKELREMKTQTSNAGNEKSEPEMITRILYEDMCSFVNDITGFEFPKLESIPGQECFVETVYPVAVYGFTVDNLDVIEQGYSKYLRVHIKENCEAAERVAPCYLREEAADNDVYMIYEEIEPGIYSTDGISYNEKRNAEAWCAIEIEKRNAAKKKNNS